MTPTNTSQVEFNIHPAIIRQMIEDQAGTLPKAVLEGVMNSADAIDRARKAGTLPDGKGCIKIEMTCDRIRVTDNGIGFQTRDEICEVFRTFGLPHEAGDARFGRFRIGRGQTFAQGRCSFRSHEFGMDVDYRGFEVGSTLGFELKEGLPYVEGCDVSIDLYPDRVLGLVEHHEALEEVKRYCRYMDEPVYLNGTLISLPPQDQKWDLETPDAWFRWRTTGGIDVYNQGVFSQNFPSWRFNSHAVVVTKKALALNQARNEIKSTCPVLKRIVEACKAQADTRMAAKVNQNLDAYEVEAVLRQLALSFDGPNYWSTWFQYQDQKVWRDVTGTYRSSNQLQRLAAKRGRLIKNPDGSIPVTFAPLRSVLGVELAENNTAVVLDATLLNQFNCQDKPAHLLSRLFGGKYSIDYRPLPEMYEAIKHRDSEEAQRFTTLDTKDLKPRERAILEAVDTTLRRLLAAEARSAFLDGDTSYSRHQTYRCLIGSGPARSWTDGRTYVALDRELIRDLGPITVGSCEYLMSVVLSQVVRTTSTQDQMAQTEEELLRFQRFYTQPSNRRGGGGIGWLMFQFWCDRIRFHGLKFAQKNKHMVRKAVGALETEAFVVSGDQASYETWLAKMVQAEFDTDEPSVVESVDMGFEFDADDESGEGQPLPDERNNHLN